ncbi:multicopper oxidase domain-containing protein [Sorangium sp. So ce295]|uniref:multicopper oxidase domain-containing protein n=1 Tax=Sorangium sp. So ce295 TaxID=3133295 RepID=UPI003F5F216A
MFTRRQFFKIGAGGTTLLLLDRVGGSVRTACAAIPGGTLDPLVVDKYVTPMLVPPAMPRAGKITLHGGRFIDYYEIAVRQFSQQILPPPHPATTVWGYGPKVAQGEPRIFNAPSLTIEADHERPIWNPEFFGNMIMVNGNTWPFLAVKQRRYRFRFLNGCQSRFLILDFNRIRGVEVWMIGNEGGFLDSPVNLTATNGNRLLMAPAERADLIVDFGRVPKGRHILANVGPDEPFGGGAPVVDFAPADWASTGQIMAFDVMHTPGCDHSTPPRCLLLPPAPPLPPEDVTRSLVLSEVMSEDFPDAPVAAMLGRRKEDGEVELLPWEADVTENPRVDDTEVWELHNLTADAHPIHIHETVFEVVNRQALDIDASPEGKLPQLVGAPRPPEPWETGYKDTVIAYPGEVTRIRAQFATAGQYVWHCHILEHEDNEMMRPYRIGRVQRGQPT